MESISGGDGGDSWIDVRGKAKRNSFRDRKEWKEGTDWGTDGQSGPGVMKSINEGDEGRFEVTGILGQFQRKGFVGEAPDGQNGGVVMGVLVRGTEGGRWEIVEGDKRGGAVTGERKAGELMSKVTGKLMRECWALHAAEDGASCKI